MAVVFPANQIATIVGPTIEYDFRWITTLVAVEGGDPEGGTNFVYDRVQQRRAVQVINVLWLCTKEPADILDILTPLWTAAPAGYDRYQAGLRVVNDRTRPMLCAYEEVWRKVDETWETMP